MKKMYVLLGGLIISGGIVAQAPTTVAKRVYSDSKTAPELSIKKAQSNLNKGAKASFLNEDFESGTFPPTNWTVNSGPASTITVPADQAWHEEPNGNPGNCASVLYNNSTDTHDEWLITPSIDLTTASASVRLEFQFNTSQFWHVTPNDNGDISVKVSTDGGTTWPTTLFVEDDLALLQAAGLDLDWEQYVWTTARVDVSAYSGMNNVMFAWHYEGTDAAQYNLDNVSIYDVEANDLTAERMYRADAGADFEYSMIPSVQARPLAMGVVNFNVGSAQQTNTTFAYDINDGSSSVDAGTASNSITSNVFTRDTIYHTTSYTPSANGVYTMTATLQSDNTDANPADNVISTTVEVTESVWACDDDVFDSFISNISGGTGDQFKIGNQFLATADQDFRKVQIGIADEAENDGQIVFGEVYIWDGTAYQLADQTLEHTISSADLGTIITLDLYNDVSVTAGDQILVVAGHYGGASDGSEDVRIATSGNSVEGNVLGFDGTNGAFQLLTPPTPVVRLQATGVGIEEGELAGMSLGQNMPNPFNNESSINYSLSSDSEVTFKVTDLTGKVMMNINKGNMPAGDHIINLNANDLPSGVYFYTLSTKNGSLTKKMTVKK